MVTANRDINKVQTRDVPVHDWYRFVLSFPPHLVRDYAERFELTPDKCVLDPFCGTGTVPVECKKIGLPSIGVEAHPMSAFATRVKLDWSPDPDGLVQHAMDVAAQAHALIETETSLRTLSDIEASLLLSDSIGDIALHKTLILLECLENARDDEFYEHERLAVARAVVRDCSNLHFGPEVGVEPASRRRRDGPVVEAWLDTVRVYADDLREVSGLPPTPSTVYEADSRHLAQVLPLQSVDAVITSPPYPNEKDYTRTTRLESVLLGFIRNNQELRNVKKGLVRSNTRGVYRDDDDDTFVADHPEIQQIAQTIEDRRIALGKTSGFERLYHRVTRLYFGGMARHLDGLRSALRPGAQLAYVVGDQASYLRVPIQTGRLIADIAESLGYHCTRIDLFRERFATTTQAQMREEVVVLRWDG